MNFPEIKDIFHMIEFCAPLWNLLAIFRGQLTVAVGQFLPTVHLTYIFDPSTDQGFSLIKPPHCESSFPGANKEA